MQWGEKNSGGDGGRLGRRPASTGVFRPAHEAGGIEPRDPDLEALLRQALTRLGEDGLASCLAAICGEPIPADVVQAWSGLPDVVKRHILDVVRAGAVE